MKKPDGLRLGRFWTVNVKKKIWQCIENQNTNFLVNLRKTQINKADNLD